MMHVLTIKGASVLVVGGAGFVGSNLVQLLLMSGIEHVHVVDNLLSAERDNLPFDNRLRFTEASITNDRVLAELKDEIINGNLDEVNAIADDVISNEDKINHHGKRADAIVKGMLQHSQTSGGVKEPTAINALADEYLRLAYHGLRAKDKGFNASFETQLDETIGMVNIQPQEIGRVILNLINNAFYAVAERKRNSPEAYDPKVTVTTKKKDNTILIIVKDNGTGIPQKVVDKIFQPFFTTKPTGQGTGLGLSLSYDIVKAHGGELKVETKEAIGSTFIISIPA